MHHSPNETKLPNGTQSALYFYDQDPLLTGPSRDGIGICTTKAINTSNIGLLVAAKNSTAQVTEDIFIELDGFNYPWFSTYDEAGALVKRFLQAKDDKGADKIYTQQDLTWDSFGRLVQVKEQDLLQNNNDTWNTIYDGLGRRIQTTSQGSTIS